MKTLIKKCIVCGKEFAKPYNCGMPEWERRKFCSIYCINKNRTPWNIGLHTPYNGKGFTSVPDDLVILTSGVINPAAAATGASVADGALLASIMGLVPTGTAAGAPSGVNAEPFVINKFDDETLFELPLATSSGASAGAPAADGLTVAQREALIGASYGIGRTSGGIYYLDLNLTSTHACANIVGLGTRYPLGDTFITVFVKILAANRLP